MARKKMLNFTVGPVQIDKEILEIGREPLPYFRTPEFSALMKENEILMKKFVEADDDARVVFLTGSGTAAMEAVVMNVFNENDKVIVINGGSFGKRFTQLCQIHDVPYSEIKLDYGEALTKKHLDGFRGKGYTGFLVNLHETSTGVYYDKDLISEFCQKNNLYLVMDSISSFIADAFNMSDLKVDVVLIGSQKALALPPGLSIIVINSRAIYKISQNDVKSMYFDLMDYLKNGERGQTPFTPAVGILIQLNKRLRMINEEGIENEIRKINEIANNFRASIQDLPFRITSESMSNALTPLEPTGDVSAFKIVEILKDEYNIFVCPTGGELADKLFRVGHIGALSIDDNSALVTALEDMKKRGII